MTQLLREAQSNLYPAGAATSLAFFHDKLDQGPQTPVLWPASIAVAPVKAWCAKGCLNSSRAAERVRLGKPLPPDFTGMLTVPLLIGSLVEDVAHVLVRAGQGSDEQVERLQADVKNSPYLVVAAVARVASILIMFRRTAAAHIGFPSDFDDLVDSQGLTAIITAVDDMNAEIFGVNYNYAEALLACHRSHQAGMKAGSAYSLDDFEVHVWMRVLIVLRNQILAMQAAWGQKKWRAATLVLAEGDLDLETWDLELAIRRDPDVGPEEDVDDFRAYTRRHIEQLRSNKGPDRSARYRFDFVWGQVWPRSTRLMGFEFKGTQLGECSAPTDELEEQVGRYVRWLRKYATRAFGVIHVIHVSSVATPSEFSCDCEPVHV